MLIAMYVSGLLPIKATLLFVLIIFSYFLCIVSSDYEYGMKFTKVLVTAAKVVLRPSGR